MSADLSDPVYFERYEFGQAQYAPTTAPGSKIRTGWLLRCVVGDDLIEGWGATKSEAKFMFEETAKRWLAKGPKRAVSL